MVNKQNLWFITLFSLILILGIYYVSIDDEVSTVLKEEANNSEEVVEINESDILVALEVEAEEEKQTMLQEYQDILLNGESTIEDKNVAYEKIQSLNSKTSEEEKLKKIIKDKFSLESFVKIKDNTISITAICKNHNAELANNIIREIQKEYTEEKYITVKFN